MIRGPLLDRPAGAQLLAEARRLLRQELLDLLPAERRLDGLMIANAMAIAARELAADPDATAAAAAEAARLAGWVPPAGIGAEEALAEAWRRLGRLIRAGRFDEGAARDDLLLHLRAAVLARLRVSNPKLAGPGTQEVGDRSVSPGEGADG